MLPKSYQKLRALAAILRDRKPENQPYAMETVLNRFKNQGCAFRAGNGVRYLFRGIIDGARGWRAIAFMPALSPGDERGAMRAALLIECDRGFGRGWIGPYADMPEEEMLLIK
jgi:hypothetical protein